MTDPLDTNAAASAGGGPAATATTVINPASLGLTGPWRTAANFGGAVLIAGSFLWLQYIIVHDGRIDRLEDRQVFREAIKTMNEEQNRRAGEIKGSVDKNTEVMRDLISEMKSWRNGSPIKPPTAVPKPISP